jgi:LPXTG-site transpeptidase (sortase) family protein
MIVNKKPMDKHVVQSESPSRWKRLQPYFFILVGLIVLPLAIWNAVLTEQKFSSPFDKLDAESGSQQGLQPVLQLDANQFEDLRGGKPGSPDAETTSQEVAAPSIPLAAAPTLEANPIPEDAELPNLFDNPGLVPENLIIPTIDLYVPIISANYRIIEFEGKTYKQWEAPNVYRAGWQTDSAGLGVPGNTVLYGHHNIAGKVFENINLLRPGDRIQLKSGDLLFTYRVVLSLNLPEKFQPLEVRLDNARWILPSYDERITLITCWPPRGNDNRIIVVAVRDETGQPEGQSGMIPITGDAETATSIPIAATATAQATPTDMGLEWAPPVEGSSFRSEAPAPDLAANPGLVPTNLLIPILNIGYPVVPIQKQDIQIDGVGYSHFEGPHVIAAGWESSSAGLGVVGNTVIFGWQDVYGGPFRELHNILPGQVIQLWSDQQVFSYRVVFTTILTDRCQDMLPESENARWVLPSKDERVTLFTCYPELGYSQRVVVVALPMD